MVFGKTKCLAISSREHGFHISVVSYNRPIRIQYRVCMESELTASATDHLTLLNYAYITRRAFWVPSPVWVGQIGNWIKTRSWNHRVPRWDAICHVLPLFDSLVRNNFYFHLEYVYISNKWVKKFSERVFDYIQRKVFEYLF